MIIVRNEDCDNSNEEKTNNSIQMRYLETTKWLVNITENAPAK